MWTDLVSLLCVCEGVDINLTLRGSQLARTPSFEFQKMTGVQKFEAFFLLFKAQDEICEDI
jgi:hypothetical protein